MIPPRLSWWQRPQPAWVMFTLNLLFMGAIFLLWNNISWAAASSTVSNTTAVQGYLTDSSGTPLDGTVNLSFTLYDAAENGNLLWGPETHNNHPISAGQYAVALGSLTSGGIPTAVWQNNDLYLETTVNSETLTPRETLRNPAVAQFAHQVAYPQLTRYVLSQAGDNTIRWQGPTGAQAALNADSCNVGSWCCEASNQICLLKQEAGADAIVDLALENTEDIACMMAHSEDDVPLSSKGFYFATDAGNSTSSGLPAIRLSRAGQSGNPILDWKVYIFTCGW